MPATLNAKLIRRSVKRGLIAVAGAVALSAIGCTSSQMGDRPRTGMSVGDASTQPTTARVSSNKAAPMFAPLPADRMIRGSLAFPTGDPKTSAIVLEKAVPAEVVSGKPYTYELVVKNVSQTKLDNVIVTETVPAGLKLSDKLEGAALAIDNDRATIKIGTLQPGEVRTLKVGATATQGGGVTAATSVTYDSMLSMGVKVVTPQLAMTKTLPADVLVCDKVPLKIALTNGGTGTARNVKLEDTLPEGITTADGKPTIFLNLGDLVAGETKNVDVFLKLTKPGAFSNSAIATADDGLRAEASASITAHQAVLELEKSGPKQQYVGVPYTYDIKVTNKGDADAMNVMLVDILPNGLIATDASDGGRIENGRVTWNLANLSKSTAKQYKLTVRGVDPGTAHNTVSAQADCAAVATVSADTALIGVPAIKLEVTEEPNPVVVGNDAVYTVTISNQGSAVATNINVVSELENQMEFKAMGGTTPGKVDGNKVTFNTLATLAPKAKAVYTITVRAKEPGDVRFKTTLTSDQLGRPVEELESTTFYK
jgi:uncharacterized repeat protein (TIGR01451 family)